MKSLKTMFLILLGLSGCRHQFKEDSETLASPNPANLAWANGMYINDDNELDLNLNFPGESSFSLGGLRPKRMSGILEIDGNQSMSGVFREQVTEAGAFPCWEFLISWDGRSAAPFESLTVSQRWVKDITEAKKRTCEQRSDFGFATKAVPGTYDRFFNAPGKVWYNRSYEKIGGGFFLDLRFGKESSFRTASGREWKFSGDLELNGVDRDKGTLRQKPEAGSVSCLEFGFRTRSDDQRFPKENISVSVHRPMELTEDQKKACDQRIDSRITEDEVNGMYKIIEAAPK